MDEKMLKRITKAITNLRNNNMAAYYVETKDEVVPLLKTLMNEGETVTHGGSETLKECGVTELLNSGAYNYLDRSKAQSPEEVEEIYRKAYFADTYLASANAVTEGGLLFNVDGNSNRVSAILYGPKQRLQQDRSRSGRSRPQTQDRRCSQEHQAFELRDLLRERGRVPCDGS